VSGPRNRPVSLGSRQQADAEFLRILSLPTGEAYRLCLGAPWQVSKAINVGAACEFRWAGDLPVTQDSAYRGRVSGAFNDSSFSFFGLNLTWKFWLPRAVNAAQ